MGRLVGFLRFAIAVVVCWLIVGTGASYIGLGLVSVLGYPLASAVFGIGLVLAIALAVFAPRIAAALPVPRWLSRTVIACSALLVCLEFAVAAVPDWSPAPLLAGFVAGSVCAVVAWNRAAHAGGETSAATA